MASREEHYEMLKPILDENNITQDLLVELNEEDLKLIFPKYGDRFIIKKKIQELRQKNEIFHVVDIPIIEITTNQQSAEILGDENHDVHFVVKSYFNSGFVRHFYSYEVTKFEKSAYKLKRLAELDYKFPTCTHLSGDGRMFVCVDSQSW